MKSTCMLEKSPAAGGNKGTQKRSRARLLIPPLLKTSQGEPRGKKEKRRPNQKQGKCKLVPKKGFAFIHVFTQDPIPQPSQPHFQGPFVPVSQINSYTSVKRCIPSHGDFGERSPLVLHGLVLERDAPRRRPRARRRVLREVNRQPPSAREARRAAREAVSLLDGRLRE